jgi:hypothetical protein
MISDSAIALAMGSFSDMVFARLLPIDAANAQHDSPSSSDFSFDNLAGPAARRSPCSSSALSGLSTRRERSTATYRKDAPIPRTIQTVG